MELALFDTVTHRVGANTASTAADALTDAVASAGERVVEITNSGGVLAIDPNMANNFWASLASGGACTVDIINHTHVVGRVKSFVLDINSVGAGTLTLAGGALFGGGFTSPITNGLNTYVFAEASNGAWQFGKVLGN